MRTLALAERILFLTTPATNRPLPLREMFLVLIGTLAVFLLLAIASYSPEDPSFNYTGANTNTQNLVGTAGAYLADFLAFFVWLDGLSATHGADLRGAATTQAARHQS